MLNVWQSKCWNISWILTTFVGQDVSLSRKPCWLHAIQVEYGPTGSCATHTVGSHEFLSSRKRPSSAIGMTFVFSVCRLVSRRCHNISAIHQLRLKPSQNRTSGLPTSGSSFNHSALQKGSG